MNLDLSVYSLPQFSSLPIKIEEVEQEMTLLLPFYIKQTLQTKEPIRASSTLPIIHELKKITKEWIDSLNKTSELPDLSFLSSPDFLNLTPEQQSAIQHHITIANELKQEKYLPEDRQRLLEISLKLTLLGIQGPSQQLDDKISNLYKRLQQTETYQIIEYGNSNDLSNNPTYLLKDKATDVSFAMLKIPRKPFDSSFSRDIPGITSLLAPVWQNELMSGEQDHLFGFNSIPTSVAVTLKNGEVVKQGIIQDYLPNMTDINQIPWEEKGAQTLNSLSTNKVHLLALESLFFGFAAGHGSNYVVERMPSDLNKITNCYIIDSKEMFIPINRASPTIKVQQVEDLKVKILSLNEELEQISNPSLESYQSKKQEIVKKEKDIQIIYQSLVVIRLWIMGLPHTKQTFNRATLLTFIHPSLLPQLQAHHKSIKAYYHVSQEALDAQMERLKSIQAKCKQALQQDPIVLTPRELFFDLFGGYEVYKVAKEKGYPDTEAFIRAVSHPYHPDIYQYSDPQTLPNSILLKGLLSKKEGKSEKEMEIYRNNLLELEKPLSK